MGGGDWRSTEAGTQPSSMEVRKHMLDPERQMELLRELGY